MAQLPHVPMAPGSLFQLDAAELLSSQSSGPLCLWSGTTAEEPFGIDPRAWMPAARAELFSRFKQLCQLAAGRGREVWLRPHARHAVGDLAIIAKWCIEPPGANFRVLLDPCSLLTAQMLPLAEDHLTRIFGAAGGPFLLPRLGGIVLANIQLPAKPVANSNADTLAIDSGPPLLLVPVSDGIIPTPTIQALAATLPSSLACFDP